MVRCPTSHFLIATRLPYFPGHSWQPKSEDRYPNLHKSHLAVLLPHAQPFHHESKPCFFSALLCTNSALFDPFFRCRIDDNAVNENTWRMHTIWIDFANFD